MGTMLQAADLTLDDFEGHEGCNEILNVTRPDVVRGVHDAYLAVGVDCVETNTFGANLANLGEYDIADRIRELAEAGARIAREVADGWSHRRTGRAGCSGSVGPGHQAADAGPRAVRRAARRLPEQVAGLLAGGVDAVLVETARTCCRPRPRSSAPGGRWPPPGADAAGHRPGHRRDDRHDAARHARSARR